MFSNPSTPVPFRQVLKGFVHSDEAFRDVLTEEQIQQAARVPLSHNGIE